MLRAENDKIKQHYKELYDSIKITCVNHIKQVTKLTTENVNLKTSVSKDKVKPQVFAREKHAIDVEPIVPRLRNNRDAHLDYLRHLKESVETIRVIVGEAMVALNNELNNLPTFLSLGRRVNSFPNASGSQPKSNVKPNRISPVKGVNKIPVEDQPRTNKSHLRTQIIVKQVWKPKQVRQVWKSIGKVLTTIGHQWRPTGQILNLGKQCPLTRFIPPKVVYAKQNKKRASCSKHMTGDRSWLMNFVKKFIGIVRFENDHFGSIIGYGDYVIGDSVISWVYYVKGLGHNLFSVGQFCDSDLEVAFRKYSCYVRDTDEAVATACYTQNRSLIHTRHHKTPYELVHNKKPDLTFFKVFGALCYPTNNSEDLGKLQPTVDIGIFVGYAPSRKGYRIYNKRT
nr:integrase, catalytic region, zinc finger, CCHC-type, peptidase aspartic, catalytic [Tanacetum cinerariifolium]